MRAYRRVTTRLYGTPARLSFGRPRVVALQDTPRIFLGDVQRKKKAAVFVLANRQPQAGPYAQRAKAGNKIISNYARRSVLQTLERP